MTATLQTFELTKIFRQENPEHAALLCRVRTGTPTQKDLNFLNERVTIKAPPKSTVISVFNQKVDETNARLLQRIDAEPHTFKAERSGTYEATWPDGKPRVACEYKEEITLKVGARVIIKRNSTAKDPVRYVNGDTGTLVEINDGELVIERDDGEIIHLHRHDQKDLEFHPRNKMVKKLDDLGFEFEEEEVVFDEEIIGRISQFPITLGYAITVHGSQGQTIERVHFVLPPVEWMANVRPTGLVYTALSRVRDLNQLTISRPLVMSDFVRRDDLLEADEQQHELL